MSGVQVGECWTYFDKMKKVNEVVEGIMDKEEEMWKYWKSIEDWKR